MPLSLHKYHYRSDAQLVADLLAGNEAAVRCLLYEQYTPLLRHNAQKAAGDKPADYDDLVQELYLYLSADGGKTCEPTPLRSVSGAVGKQVPAGKNKCAGDAVKQ